MFGCDLFLKKYLVTETQYLPIYLYYKSDVHLQIIVECFGALATIVIGLLIPIRFEPVIMTADRASRAHEESFSTDFTTFNHRSRDLKKRSENYLKSK